MEMKQLWILLKLSNLAKLFDHREMWSYVTSLKSLAWAVVKEQSPALVSLSPLATIAALETSGVFRHETFPEGYIHSEGRAEQPRVLPKCGGPVHKVNIVLHPQLSIN